MNSFWNTLQEGLGRLSTRQKVQIGLAFVATVGAIWSLSLYATRVRYGVLFSHLDQEDAARVVSLLHEQQTPYRLSGPVRSNHCCEGTSYLVGWFFPRSMVPTCQL